MGPKTMATSSKGAFSIAVVSGARGKGGWLAATAIGLICLSGTTKPADAFGGFLFGGDSTPIINTVTPIINTVVTAAVRT